MFRPSLCPSSGEQERVLLHFVFCTVTGGGKTLKYEQKKSNFYLNMFRACLCPSSGDQDRLLLHMVFCVLAGAIEDSMAHILRFPFPVTVQNTICNNKRSCSPDDGHNDARNMLR